jgi:hypothetical protein
LPQIRYVALCTPVPGGGCDAHGPTCPTPGKRPLVADWANSWTPERPEGNAGVLTGPETGLLVIDVDTWEAGETVARWELPDTFVVKSGRPGGIGRHLYYRWPAGLERVPNRLDGVEVKGAGRQVVAWDSLHASGSRYEKLGGGFAELPDWFVARLRESTPQHSLSEVLDATPEASAALDRLLAVLPDAHELRDGNWEATCPAHADHDPSLVVTASDNRVLVHCRAGCPAGDVMAALGLSLSDLWAREALPQKELAHEKRRLGAPDSLGERFRLTELMAAELGTVRWAVPGMVPDGLTLLAGPPKLGKSWLVLDLAIQVASGGRFLDSDVPQGDALYLALEDNPRRLQGRARMLLAGQAPPERLELWTRAGKLGARDAEGRNVVDQIEAWLDEQADPRLVIIDTLGRVQDGGSLESKDGGYADAVEALAGLQDVAAARGVAVVVITHTKKGGWSATGDPLEAVLGSQGYAGTADSILVLKRERGEPLGQLFVTGREIEEELTHKIRFDDVACRWVVGHELSLEQEIIQAVTAKPFQLTGTGIVRAVGARKQEVLAVLAALEAAGRLIQQEPAGGGWSRWGLPIPNNGGTP